MAIEFDKSHTPPVNPAAGSQAGAREAHQRTDADSTMRPAGAAGDAVTLTDVSSRLRDLVAESGQEPPVDQKRVDALRNAIADGSFQVDSSSLAERILQREGELFK